MSFKKVFKPVDKVEYQRDNIVSKTLVENNNSSITLFAMDEAERINTHTAPVDASLLVLEGEVEVIIDDEMFNLDENKMIIIPAQAPHSLNSITKSKLMLIKT